ncbi:hypothetical protein PDE_03996 [Penicillium oxalicum 114-2]|uniref:Uncharacterized protein n=1 Tax=Penicillium oxalicum (strain 114-2 / CGMCC 5302) TaxID=933388 RepID=S7ZFI6_PENO1|nr:hypothetical protein PDE_03996 [Penicillium oxalicum 114-2]
MIGQQNARDKNAEEAQAIAARYARDPEQEAHFYDRSLRKVAGDHCVHAAIDDGSFTVLMGLGRGLAVTRKLVASATQLLESLAVLRSSWSYDQRLMIELVGGSRSAISGLMAQGSCIRPHDAAIGTWARHPGPALCSESPDLVGVSDHMPRPARDLNPRVYLQSELQSLRVVWLAA